MVISVVMEKEVFGFFTYSIYSQVRGDKEVMGSLLEEMDFDLGLEG